MATLKKRKLVAVLFADIAGYTALMQKDEHTSRQQLEKFRLTLNKKVKEQEGEIIQYYGDGCLCTFDSAVNAVSCAKEIQLIFQSPPKVPVRIGVHSGDVFFEADNVFGDSVNIASRIESLGVPGAILFSKRIQRDIANQIELKAQSLGVFHFKNVEKEMEVFALANEGCVIPKRAEMKGKIKSPQPSKNKWLMPTFISLALLLASLGFWKLGFLDSEGTSNEQTALIPSKNLTNSLAILPFANMSEKKENEYFSEGIHDDLLTHISKLSEMKVISRTSVNHYRNTEKKIPQIAAELGVAHILEGSVRRAGNQVRINVQLIKADTDDHLWAEIYDRELTTKNIFEIQTEIVEKIAKQLSQSINSETINKNFQAYTDNLLAYENYLRAKQLKETGNKESLYKAKSLLEEALQLDANFAEAITLLGNLHIHLVYYGGANPEEYFPKSWELMEESLALKPNASTTYALKGSLYHWWKRDIEGARKAYDKAILINPNNENALYGLAIAIQDLDMNKQEILPLLDKAIAINPLNPNLININGIYKRENEQYAEALQVFKKGVEIAPKHANLWKNYAETYYYVSRIDSVLIINQQCVHQNGKTGQFLSSYLTGLSNLSLLDLLEKETKIKPSDTQQDIDIKLVFKRDLHLQRKEFNQVEEITQELRNRSINWVDVEVYEFENTYLKKDFEKAVDLYEAYTSDLDLSEDIKSFSMDEISYFLYYVFSLKQINQSHTLKQINNVFESLVFDEANSPNERTADTFFRIYMKSFFFQIKGNTEEASKLLDLYFSKGNLYNIRWLELDPIFDDARNKESYQKVIAKYKRIIEEQRINYIKNIDMRGMEI